MKLNDIVFVTLSPGIDVHAPNHLPDPVDTSSLSSITQVRAKDGHDLADISRQAPLGSRGIDLLTALFEIVAGCALLEDAEKLSEESSSTLITQAGVVFDRVCDPTEKIAAGCRHTQLALEHLDRAREGARDVDEVFPTKRPGVQVVDVRVGYSPLVARICRSSGIVRGHLEFRI